MQRVHGAEEGAEFLVGVRLVGVGGDELAVRPNAGQGQERVRAPAVQGQQPQIASKVARIEPAQGQPKAWQSEGRRRERRGQTVASEGVLLAAMGGRVVAPGLSE